MCTATKHGTNKRANIMRTLGGRAINVMDDARLAFRLYVKKVRDRLLFRAPRCFTTHQE